MFCRVFTRPKGAKTKIYFTAYLYLCGSVCHHQGPPVRSSPDSMQLVYIYCCPSYVIPPPMWICGSVYYPALPIYALILRFKAVLKGFYILEGHLYYLGACVLKIGFSCVWEVRRLCGLWRVCPSFYIFCPLFYPFCPLIYSVTLLFGLISLALFKLVLCLFF